MRPFLTFRLYLRQWAVEMAMTTKVGETMMLMEWSSRMEAAVHREKCKGSVYYQARHQDVVSVHSQTSGQKRS